MESYHAGSIASYQRQRRLVLAVLITLFTLLLVFGAPVYNEVVQERYEGNGTVLILIGIGGRLWSILYIGGRKSAELVTDGPYSIMRNPLYFFSTIAAAGIGAQTGSATVMVAAVALCAVAFHIVALREERHLKAVLGAPYDDYLARVPRFLPNPRLFKDQAEVTFQPRLLKTTMVDGLALLLSVPLFELIEQGQENGWIPVLFNLY